MVRPSCGCDNLIEKVQSRPVGDVKTVSTICACYICNIDKVGFFTNGLFTCPNTSNVEPLSQYLQM